MVNETCFANSVPKILSLFLLPSKFHQICLQKSINISIHNALDIRGLVVGAVVFHTAVVEYVAANLAAPFDFQLARLDFVLLFHTVTHLAVVELRLQEAQGVLAVLGLVAGFGVFDEDFLFLARVGVFVLVAQTHS